MRIVANGLFFHPHGESASAVLRRMAEGTTNYNLDDPFKPAIEGTRFELEEVERKIKLAERRLRLLEDTKNRLEKRKIAQQEAQEHFAETGEIDPILVPSVEALAKAEAAAEREKVKKTEQFDLPVELKEGGWEADKTVRVTDTEIIVTIRKRRTDTPVDVGKAEERIKKAVEFAMQPFRTDASRYRRALRDRIAKRPQQPKGPPDD